MFMYAKQIFSDPKFPTYYKPRAATLLVNPATGILKQENNHRSLHLMGAQKVGNFRLN